MNRILVFLLLAVIFYTNKGSAQDILKGRVYEEKTTVGLSGVRIEDLKTHTAVLADTAGRFAIKVIVGDFIKISGFAYQPDTVYVANFKYLVIYLKAKQTMLNEVKVQNVQTKTGKLSAAPITGAFGSQDVLFQTNAKKEYIGGVKVKIFDSDANAKRKRRDAQISDNEEKQLEIFKVFQVKNLSNYLPIKGVEMDNFIILYTPDIPTYFDPGFNLTSYLNISYKKFLELPASERTSETAFRLVTKADSTKKEH